MLEWWGENRTFLHCWWECKLIQPLWKTVWRIFKNWSKTTMCAVLIHFSHVWLFLTFWMAACELLCTWVSSDMNTGVGRHTLFQGIFLSQGWNLCLLHLLHLLKLDSLLLLPLQSDWFTWATKSCPTLCDPRNHSMLGLPVQHQLPEFTETHVHWVGGVIQQSHPLSFPSASNPSKHQSLFQ